MSLKSSVEKMPGYNTLVLPVHWVQAVRAGMKYHWPAKGLRVIGVTGTNGKTTTSFMIWKMLNQAGHKCGLLTTVAWGGVNGDELDVVDEGQDARHLHKQYEHMTTERVGVLNARMRAIADAGAEFMVLEVTSHALAQFRTLGVPVEVAVFTNLTHDHLDYHKTVERYRAAKLKLFKQAKKGVINADDPSARYFVRALSKGVRVGGAGQVADGGLDYSSDEIITYGIERGGLRAKEVELAASGLEYACGDIFDKSWHLTVKTQIPGQFNVYNSLAAVGAGRLVGLTKQEIAEGIASLSAVEGRMTRVREGQDFEVIVDYAHAPDALEKVFESVQGGAKGRRIIAVHGGAGRRDHSTRAPRGEILGRYSDIVIITEDDSRDEDPAEIAAMFVEGAERAGKVREKDLYVELDRAKAIEKAIGLARPGDLVLILGKGHEKTILRGNGPHPFEDIKVATAVLRKK